MLSRNHGALGGVGLNDGLRVLVEGDEPLLDGVDIVVSTSRSLCTLEQPGCHGLIGHLEVKDVLAGSNSFLKLLSLGNFTWITINQESRSLTSLIRKTPKPAQICRSSSL